MIESPIYTVNRASTSQVIRHLETCNENFMPPLSDRVNIKEYSLKLTRTGMRFEAWADEALVGLVAAYCDNSHDGAAFITNVSVQLRHQGQGVARRLLTNCKSYSEENFFQCIQLKVNSKKGKMFPKDYRDQRKRCKWNPNEAI